MRSRDPEPPVPGPSPRGCPSEFEQELERRAATIGRLERELTEQIEVAAALAQEKERLQTILDTASDGILAIDEHGVIESANTAAEQLFGYEPDELTGRPLQVLMPERKGKEQAAPLARYLLTGESQVVGGSREVVGRRKDGTSVELEVSVGERRVAGRRTFTGILRDISAHKALERKLRRSQEELQQAQKLEAIGRLSGGLAHEYRNLLLGIQGFTSMALESLGQSPARPHVEEIRAAAWRGAALTAQLLSYSRKSGAALAVLRVDETIRASAALLRSLLGEGVHLELLLDAPEGRVRAGEGWVEQILLNLALNASDAMKGRGDLVVRTRVVDGTDRRVVWISVRDTGPGMDASTTARVFEPFFTTKPPGQGTGLGLPSVEALVSQMEGTIDVASAVGFGTTFNILLPWADEREEIIPAEPPQAPCSGAPLTVLVVEDERLVLLTVEHYLRRAGYTPLLAASPEQALELAQAHPGSIDVLLTDVSLPKMGGGELADAVRAHRPEIAVLFMSAFPREQLVAKGWIDPSCPSIEKPFREHDLVANLARVSSAASALRAD